MTETTSGQSSVPNRVWISWNIGEKYGNGMSLFVGGDSYEEFVYNLEELFGKAFVDLFHADWDAYVTDTLPGKPVTTDQAIKNLRSGGVIGDEPQHGENRKCRHGDMKYRNGTSSKGPWSGWFCPKPKGDPDQCKAIFA